MWPDWQSVSVNCQKMQKCAKYGTMQVSNVSNNLHCKCFTRKEMPSTCFLDPLDTPEAFLVRNREPFINKVMNSDMTLFTKLHRVSLICWNSQKQTCLVIFLMNNFSTDFLKKLHHNIYEHWYKKVYWIQWWNILSTSPTPLAANIYKGSY